MARGFESKAVEAAQIEDSTRKRDRSFIAPTIEESLQTSKIATLELSRSRIVRELDGTSSEVHKTALQNALNFLDDEIKKLTR